MNHYYDAYDKRYQIIHKKGYSWSSDIPTPIISDVIHKHSISKNASITIQFFLLNNSENNTLSGVTAILCVLLERQILILYANILKIRVSGIHPID
jgi:hypothetical protein